MEDMIDAEERRFRPNSYGPSQPSSAHRLPPADAASLHNYPPPPAGTAMQYSAPTWHPPPSPYESHDHRSTPPDLPNPHANAPQPYPQPNRDQSIYGHQDPSYSRADSISAPSRSPAEGTHPQFQAVNGNIHESQYQPHPGAPDYRTRPGYGPPDTPVNGTQPPGLHLVTGHEVMSGHPQSLPPSAHYGHPSSAAPHPSPGYQPPYYGQHDMNYTGQRRKPVRAAQACDSCRQRKAKCDEGRPDCQHCKDNGLKCFYRDVPLQKQDKQAQAMTEKLDTMSDNIKVILEIQQNQARQLDMLQSFVPPERKTSHYSAQQENYGTSAHTPPVKEDPSTALPSNPNRIATAAQNQYQEQTTDPYLAPEYAMPVKHSTGAQNLLSWPSIKALLPKDRLEEFKESYVMDLEANRGLLRLYGCGEGEDPHDGGAGAPSPANSSDSSSRNDDEVTASPRGGVWGNGQLTARSPGPDPSNRDHAGGVGTNGSLILDADLVDTYVASYLSNIHILHPFLDVKVLQDMVTRFKRRYSWGYFPLQHKGLSTGKRKRTTGDSPGLPTEVNPSTRPYHTNSEGFIGVEHSITNAIILLVLALGKICAHKAPLPGPMLDSSIPTSNPYSTFPELSTSASAPNSPNVYPGVKLGVTSAVVSGPADPRGKNMDVIPGLAYYAKAANIIGELVGGCDVSHIQANLLAGLYMGQLARIFPSHQYIADACKWCQVLIESSEYKSATIKPARRNLINFAFWTSLQLESDILAEVEIPVSGITRYETKMSAALPTGVTLVPNPEQFIHGSQTPETIVRFYSHQIQLRRMLNDIHSNLYNNDKEKNEEQSDSKPKFPNLNMMTILDGNLEAWKGQLGPLNWEHYNHKSSDINVARMRAKYYGAKYITHRPALRYLLALRSGSTPGTTPGSNRPSESPVVGPGHRSQFSSPAVPHNQAVGMIRRQSEMAPPNRSNEPFNVEPQVLQKAEECVRAAIRSTTVFDDVPERIIVTNIFGTAHAQFGNMLVLAATYNSELSSLVDGKQLKQLLDRTIRFLKLSEAISPSLQRDAQLLEYIRATLFTNQPSSSANNSFTSA